MSDRHEGGFTLVELLLSMSIMLIIIVPLTASFVIGLSTTNGALQDTTNSADAQVLAGFLDTDVANAETVSATTSCGGTGTLLELHWLDGAVAETVAYRRTPDAAMQAELNVAFGLDRLERVRCEAGAAVETSSIARSVLHIGGLSLTCDGGSCAAASKPHRVELQVIEYTPQLADAGASGHYTFGVTATRKVTT